MPWALLFVLACGRIDFDPVDTPPLYWGEFADQLPVRRCAAETDLIVDDTTDALDGGMTIATRDEAGPTLSFGEAMWIAANRPGADTIVFDGSVFPVDAPATIRFGQAAELPVSISDVCIDGRKRGVIVDWVDGGLVLRVPTLVDSLLVGVTYLNTPNEMSLVRSQMAGVRLGTDGFVLADTDLSRFWGVEGVGADGVVEIGPGNVIARRIAAIRVFGTSAEVRVYGNGIGFDLLTGATIDTKIGLDIDLGARPLVVEDNIMSVTLTALRGSTDPADDVRLARNRIGVGPNNEPLASAMRGLDLGAGNYVVGPDNVIVGNSIGVHLAQTTARITRNRITGNQQGIVWLPAPPVAAPTVTAATRTQIAGQCASGTIEVFADPGDQGATFLGATSCAGGTFTLTGSFPASTNVTATETVAGGTSGFSVALAVP